MRARVHALANVCVEQREKKRKVNGNKIHRESRSVTARERGGGVGGGRERDGKETRETDRVKGWPRDIRCLKLRVSLSLSCRSLSAKEPLIMKLFC